MATAKRVRARGPGTRRPTRAASGAASRDPQLAARSPIGAAFLRGVEDALWLPAWAAYIEEEDARSLPRHITRDTAEPMPDAVEYEARRFAAELSRLNRGTIVDLWRRASEADGREVDPEALGYYLTMQALGHGVGWTDDHEPFDVLLPSIEANAYRADRGWEFDVSMTRGQRSREIGRRLRRRWHGVS